MNIKPEDGKIVACSLQFQGNVVPKDVMAAVGMIKTMRTVQFVDWAPTGFRCGIDYHPPVYLPEGPLQECPIGICGLINTTNVASSLDSIASQFDVLFTKHAFLHHYINESGLEIDDIREAREHVSELIHDYFEAGLDADENADDKTG